MPPGLLLDLLALAAGLTVGSYLNVVAYRLPRSQSTVTPRSACPWCGGAIQTRDNIPVLSYLLLRGRCRRCRGPISARYPAIEALTGLLFVACVERFGATPAALAAIVFCCLLVVLAAIDVEYFLLPDRLTLPGIAIGLGLQRWLPGATLLEAAVGTAVGAGILILVINAWFWLRGDEGMGLGDVNMLAMIGAFVGWKGALLALAAGAAAGAVTGIALVASGRLGLRSQLPFGLFLAIGGVIALLAGPSPIDLLLGP